MAQPAAKFRQKPADVPPHLPMGLEMCNKIVALRFAVATVLAVTAGPIAGHAQTPAPAPAVMSCEQIVAEIAAANAEVTSAAGGVSTANGSAKMAELGASAAINGALYSGALSKVPGLGMFAGQASNLMKQRAAAKAASESQRMQAAQMRMVQLQGVYQGRNCASGPVQPVVTPAAAVALPAAAPTPAAAPGG